MESVSVPTRTVLRTWRDDRGDAIEGAPAEALGFGCKPSALIVGQSKAAATHLLLQYAILFDKVRVSPLPGHPAARKRRVSDWSVT